MLGLSLADKVITGTYNFVYLIVKIILLGLASVWSAPAAVNAQYFVHLIFNSILQLMTFQVISKNVLIAQYLLHFLDFLFAPSATVSPDNLVLYSRDLKLLLAISALTSVAPSLE